MRPVRIHRRRLRWSPGRSARKTGSRVGLNLTTQLETGTRPSCRDREPGVARGSTPSGTRRWRRCGYASESRRPWPCLSEPPRLSEQRSPRLSRFESEFVGATTSWDQPYCGRTRSGPSTSPPRSSPPRSPPGHPKRSAPPFSSRRQRVFGRQRARRPIGAAATPGRGRKSPRRSRANSFPPKLKRASAANWTKPASHIGRLAASGSERRVMMIFLKVHFGLFLPGFRLSFGSAQRKIPGFLLELGE